MRYSDRLSKSQKLKVFFDLACNTSVVGNRMVLDASDGKNREKAQRWLDVELSFLKKADRHDLISAWEMAIEDGRDVYSFSNFVNILADKYQESCDYFEVTVG